MPLTSGQYQVQRKFLSEVVKGVSLVEIERGIQVSTATVDVGAATDTVEEPIGIPLVWDNGNSYFVRYVDQDISAVTGSPLPNGSAVAIAVGDRRGSGFNTTDVTLGTVALPLTVLYRDAQVDYAGVAFGAATSGDIAEFKQAMEKQQVVEVAAAANVATSYIS
tara:strand:- start:39182 stop:39673 length:492 start_codon:yes stop_codon:yes gene_type:complete